jgi:hypothetical protein
MQPADLTPHDDGTPQHVKICRVTEDSRVVRAADDARGFAHHHFVRPPAGPQHSAGAGRAAVVVISYRVWRDLYAAILRCGKRSTSPRSRPRSPASRRDFDAPHGGDFWFSQQLDKDDINHFFDGFMRLKPGVALERANAEMASVMMGRVTFRQRISIAPT